MASDLRAAAERLVADNAGWHGVQNSVSIDGFDYEWLLKIAAAYLAEHREDDDTKIDEAWLESLPTPSGCGPKSFGLESRMNVERRGSKWCACLEQATNADQTFEEHDPDHIDVVIIEIANRGHLRKLCESLGVTLREKT